ncbi:MAG: siderophore-interacting protein [Actinomycetota bacterium]
MHHGVVEAVEQLSPSMVRVVLSGGTLDEFEMVPFTDAYVNAYFPPPSAELEVPFDVGGLSEMPDDQRPRPRRFTVRAWDAERQRLTIDFVAHGDVGFAGRWAQHAEPGDRLQFRGPGGGFAPDAASEWMLLVGDESALPAIAASIDAATPEQRVIVIAVVDGPDCELDLPLSASTEVTWLHRKGAAEPDQLLVDAVDALELPSGQGDVFVHGEAGETRAVRRLLADRGVDLGSASISPYWRRRHTDEEWRKVKSQWLAEEA